MALWGITGIQTFTFFINNTRDKMRFKILIGVLYIADTFHSILICHLLYHYLISNYLNPLAVMIPLWSVLLVVATTSICDFIIRGLFALRVYRLSNRKLPVALLIGVLSLGDLVVGLIITVKAFSMETFLELDHLSTLMFLNFALGTSSDLLVAAALCYYLYLSRTGIAKTNSLINTLMAYTVNTGMIVAIDAALGVILYGAMPNNFIFLGFYFLLSKLYLNSYLASLNARDTLRQFTNEPVSLHFRSNRYATQDDSHVSELSSRTVREKSSYERAQDSQQDIALATIPKPERTVEAVGLAV